MNNLNFDQLFKKYDYLVFFDTETTGLDPERDHITELAAIKVVKEEEQGWVTNIISSLLKLPEGVVIPEFLEKLTGITNEVIREEGRDWSEVYEEFTTLFEKDKKGLVIAYNAQFDLMFMQHQFLAFKELDVDYLDSLTVFREIEAYPHKLSDAINRFKLQGCINSHCAADDTAALIMVTEALSNRCNLLDYVNRFGYVPKYGKPKSKIDKIKYFPQNRG